MTRAYLKICVGQNHDIGRVREIIHRYGPIVVVLESEAPSLNNRVIRYAQIFTNNGWKKVAIELVTKYKRSKKGTKEFHMISVMLKRSNEAGAEEILRGE